MKEGQIHKILNVWTKVGQTAQLSLIHELSSRLETVQILSSFKPIPSISQPTPEEIQRDVDVVFHNLGLDSQSPIRDYNNGVQDAPFPVQDAPFSVQDAPYSAQDAPYSAQDAFTYDFDDASMTHSITAEEACYWGHHLCFKIE